MGGWIEMFHSKFTNFRQSSFVPNQTLPCRHCGICYSPQISRTTFVREERDETTK